MEELKIEENDFGRGTAWATMYTDADGSITVELSTDNSVEWMYIDLKPYQARAAADWLLRAASMVERAPTPGETERRIIREWW